MNKLKTALLALILSAGALMGVPFADPPPPDNECPVTLLADDPDDGPGCSDSHWTRPTDTRDDAA